MAVSTTLDTYPTTINPTYGYTGEEQHRSVVTTMVSGVSESNTLWRFPRRIFSLGYAYLSDTDRATLHNFYRNQRGAWKEFYYRDFTKRSTVDEFVGYGGPLDVDGAVALDGTVYTDETDHATDATHDDMTLLPAAPAQNDAYYFGSRYQFDKLTITLNDQGAPAYNPGVAGWHIHWEYWDGNSWEVLAGLADGTTGFTAAAGDVDVTFTVPTDWAIYEIEDRYLYWIRARVETFVTCTTPPTATQAWTNSKTYSLHVYSGASVSIYINGTLKAGGGADYTYVNGGGPASVDRITLTNYPTTGDLITSDFTGYLTVLARFAEDGFGEEAAAPMATAGEYLYNISTKIKESNI